jgi:hypothetical protein
MACEKGELLVCPLCLRFQQQYILPAMHMQRTERCISSGAGSAFDAGACCIKRSVRETSINVDVQE